MRELLRLTTTLSALGAGGAAAEVATLASAGRPGLELQIPAPVGRQQRRHVQHTGVHADPRQPQRAPLLQLPSRGLPSLTARGRQAHLHPPLAGPLERSAAGATSSNLGSGSIPLLQRGTKSIQVGDQRGPTLEEAGRDQH